MSTYPFRHRAIAFLRDSMDLHCVYMPQNRIEDERGNARFDGALVDNRLSSPLNLASLYAFTLAATLAMVNERPLGSGAHEALAASTIVCLVAGVVGLVASFVFRRRGTTHVHIELRGDDVVGIEGIERARSHAGKRAAWIVAEHGFTGEALALAEQHDVRCFATTAAGITECVATVVPGPDLAKAA